MSDTRYDAIVIGGGAGGLIASAYLAKAGRHVLLLEAEDTIGGSCRATTSLAGVSASLGAHVLHALDPRIVTELNLARRGLAFAIRDMPLVSLRQGGTNLVLDRDPHTAARKIAVSSLTDAEAYKRYRAEMFALARTMRSWWWENAASLPRQQSAFLRHLLAQLEATSAVALLNERFESDTLKAALAFDAVAPFEPGSALTLVWRAAQEMCGLQGAVAVPRGGLAALADLLANVAQEAGVEIRTMARVAKLILADNAVIGVELEFGERVFARAILSSLCRCDTLLELAPTASAGFAGTFALRRDVSSTGDAAILFRLNAAPGLGGRDVPPASRFIIADRLDSYASAETAGREARLPDDLLMEAVSPTAADASLAPPGQYLLSVRVRGLPLASTKSAKLVERVVAALEPHTVRLRERIVGLDVRPPVETGAFSGSRMLSSYAGRIGTPIDGLFLCGGAAEPVDAISGRAGRIAANLANAWLAREKRT